MKGFEAIKKGGVFPDRDILPGSKEGCGAKRGLRCCQGFEE